MCGVYTSGMQPSITIHCCQSHFAKNIVSLLDHTVNPDLCFILNLELSVLITPSLVHTPLLKRGCPFGSIGSEAIRFPLHINPILFILPRILFSRTCQLRHLSALVTLAVRTPHWSPDSSTTLYLHCFGVYTSSVLSLKSLTLLIAMYWPTKSGAPGPSARTGRTV